MLKDDFWKKLRIDSKLAELSVRQVSREPMVFIRVQTFLCKWLWESQDVGRKLLKRRQIASQLVSSMIPPYAINQKMVMMMISNIQ